MVYSSYVQVVDIIFGRSMIFPRMSQIFYKRINPVESFAPIKNPMSQGSWSDNRALLGRNPDVRPWRHGLGTVIEKTKPDVL